MSMQHKQNTHKGILKLYLYSYYCGTAGYGQVVVCIAAGSEPCKEAIKWLMTL